MKNYSFQRSFAEQARKLGAAWEDASTPFFVRFHEDGSLIAHVGVLEIPMRLMGEDVIVGGVHAVATHPANCRRGYYREIMNEVLDYCDKRYETLVLTTCNPEFYQPFGFRYVLEHSFEVLCNSLCGVNGMRLLNTGDQSFGVLEKRTAKDAKGAKKELRRKNTPQLMTLINRACKC